MILDKLLEIKPNLIDSQSYYPGQKVKFDLEFINYSDKEFYLKDVHIYYECTCSINLFHLKRFHRKNSVERFLNNFNQQNPYNSNQNIYDNNDFLLLKTDLLVFENKILRAKDVCRTPIKFRIPERSLLTYKSKYIHFYNLIRIKVNLINCEVPTKDVTIAITVKDYVSNETVSTSDYEFEETQISNPFDIKENYSDDSLENDLFSKIIFEKQATTRYKITYHDSELCYLTLLKSRLTFGDDIKIVLNFVGNSSIKCVKFSNTLIAKENLFSNSMDTNEEQVELCLSKKEFGPYFHDSLCVEVYPLTIRLPNDQYPSLNFEIFKFEWYLQFKFMIVDSTDININILESPPKQPVTWSLKKDIKTELLKWELPIHIYSQKILEI